MIAGPAAGEHLSYREERERKTGSQVRIGRGPHVKHCVKVYVTKKRLEKLQWLIDLYDSGQEGANETRDRISTRRARTANRRNDFSNWF